MRWWPMPVIFAGILSFVFAMAPPDDRPELVEVSPVPQVTQQDVDELTARIEKLEAQVGRCSHQVDIIGRVIRVIEARRGSKPPRMLDEAWDPWVGDPNPEMMQ